jgi:hypothetical protein
MKELPKGDNRGSALSWPNSAQDAGLSVKFIDEDTLELFENVCAICAHVHKESDNGMNSKCR